MSRAYDLAKSDRTQSAPLARATDPSTRIRIRSLAPTVENGAFAVKRTVGDCLAIEADVVVDGHGAVAAAAIIGRDEERASHRVPMASIGNDRWQCEVPLAEEGHYKFAVEAWLDVYGAFVRDLEKKQLAQQDVSLDVREGRALIESARKRTKAHVREALDAVLAGMDSLAGTDLTRLLVAKETIAAMAAADARPFLTRSFKQSVEAERKLASFASWYELFPRSLTNDSARHGTFHDVIARLPDIAAMGFDVLYFPPIHPIGTTNRKGRNNSLIAEATDPGSPYAIGSGEGGHDTIHKQLGTLADFRTLVGRAHQYGIEIALDFAVQCSPDHPWLKEHPGWFEWRPDGSIRFAENPPKKYEDIVNVDFYSPDAVPDLWIALRDIVDFWIAQGVKIFRVDNPHTKPLPFWAWLIADIRERNPEVMFLAEAFTRPKIMHELAKIGFNQSYTYFTWRRACIDPLRSLGCLFRI